MEANRDALYDAVSRLTRRLRKHRHNQLKRRKTQCSRNLAQLSSLSIPSVNPFLYEVQKVKHEERVRRNRSKPDDPIEIQHLPQSSPTSLRLAKSARTFDTTKAMASQRKLARLSATVLYVRYHHLEDSMIARYILSDRLEGEDIAQQLLVKKILKDSIRYQTQIMSFYLSGVHATIRAMGGLELWSAATKQQRQTVFGLIFDSRPLDMATSALATAASAIPLSDIFSDDTKDHLKWQQYHRYVFVSTCESVFQLRIDANEDRRKECYKRWKAISNDKEVTALGLGGVEDIPVPWITSGRRRQVLKVIPSE